MLIVYYSPIIHRLVTTEKILKKAVTKKKRKRYSRKSWESRKKPKKQYFVIRQWHYLLKKHSRANTYDIRIKKCRFC